MQKAILEKLGAEKNNPCVTISMKTHRTHPDNATDVIELKVLVSETKKRLIAEFGKKEIADLLKKLENIELEIDANYNLDSLHIFLSNTTKEIVKSSWTIDNNSVQISNTFAIKPLIKALNRTDPYLIMVLSQSGVHLYYAINDTIINEIKNDDFPFPQNPHILENSKEKSNAKLVDSMVAEYFHTVDKALVHIYNENHLHCVVVSTDDNYSKLIHLSMIPAIYYGNVTINYTDMSNHTIVKDTWVLIQKMQKSRILGAIDEMIAADSQNNVITDLTDIYQAVKEGRGELMIIQENYKQAVKFTGDYTFDLVDDNTLPGVVDDITSDIALDLINTKGRVVFINNELEMIFGKIALKLRY